MCVKLDILESLYNLWLVDEPGRTASESTLEHILEKMVSLRTHSRNRGF